MASTATKAQASVIYDEDALTQPYVVMVDGVEVFRHGTRAWCDRYIAWHGYELVEQLEEVEAIAVEESVQVSTEDVSVEFVSDDFGDLYRVRKGEKLLGTFYRGIFGGWIAQPANSDFRPRLKTPEQAQLVVIASWM